MSFSADLSKYAKRTKSDIGQAKRAVVFNVFREVIKKTPVDTGRAKANWFVSDDAPSLLVDARKDKSGIDRIGASSKAELDQITTKLGLDFLTNNLPYIERLEFGYSNQAPAGMLRSTLRQFIQIAQKQGWK